MGSGWRHWSFAHHQRANLRFARFPPGESLASRGLHEGFHRSPDSAAWVGCETDMELQKGSPPLEVVHEVLEDCGRAWEEISSEGVVKHDDVHGLHAAELVGEVCMGLIPYARHGSADVDMERVFRLLDAALAAHGVAVDSLLHDMEQHAR